jgi:hypothetical protein
MTDGCAGGKELFLRRGLDSLTRLQRRGFDREPVATTDCCFAGRCSGVLSGLQDLER